MIHHLIEMQFGIFRYMLFVTGISRVWNSHANIIQFYTNAAFNKPNSRTVPE